MDGVVDPIDVDSIDLPHDYLEVTEELGSGFTVDDKLSILHPKVVSRDFRQHQIDLEAIHGKEGVYVRQGKLMFSEPSVDSSYVSFSSLVCWGLENSGKKIFWNTRNSGTWSIVVTNCSDVWAFYDDMTSSEYLHGLLLREFDCPVLTGENWPRVEYRDVLLHSIGL
ncbi:hypothetical protein [Nocardiopsis sp. NRRL B-16309]|uniref:hypothetical protein n=1 Tax=Nocardiopsis sp. NRRL B-16309 TaxID=1519494 RepID=UPI0012E1A9C6|nr:hypothetical protein [Nocardiopsis sp. NRRL B-16309]